MKANVLIAASAGTGKTQALAERLIALVKGGLEPHEIVALTFSRAAAGEIFERFVSLLAERAKGDPSCAALLRKVIATQHLSQIGTLDSFLMRIVRSFPLELGLDGGVEIMDDYRAGQELARTSFSILRRTDASARLLPRLRQEVAVARSRKSVGTRMGRRVVDMGRVADMGCDRREGAFSACRRSRRHLRLEFVAGVRRMGAELPRQFRRTQGICQEVL